MFLKIKKPQWGLLEEGFPSGLSVLPSWLLIPFIVKVF